MVLHLGWLWPCSSLKKLCREKHSSLFCSAVSEEEKKFLTLTPDALQRRVDSVDGSKFPPQWRFSAHRYARRHRRYRRRRFRSKSRFVHLFVTRRFLLGSTSIQRSRFLLDWCQAVWSICHFVMRELNKVCERLGARYSTLNDRSTIPRTKLIGI